MKYRTEVCKAFEPEVNAAGRQQLGACRAAEAALSGKTKMDQGNDAQRMAYKGGSKPHKSPKAAERL